jgi:hypothetical protein
MVLPVGIALWELQQLWELQKLWELPLHRGLGRLFVPIRLIRLIGLILLQFRFSQAPA